MDSISMVAADGRAGQLRVIEAACWGEGAPGQRADAHAADVVVPASLALISCAWSALLHVVV
jgi:hypothetical protein